MFYKRRIDVSNLNTAEALVMDQTDSITKIIEVKRCFVRRYYDRPV